MRANPTELYAMRPPVKTIIFSYVSALYKVDGNSGGLFYQLRNLKHKKSLQRITSNSFSLKNSPGYVLK